LRGALLYEDAVSEGMYILSHVSEIGRTEKSCMFLNEFGMLFYNVGDYKKAIECHEKALGIGKDIYGERHPVVATRLNNLGLAWDSLGNSKKAYDYIQRAHKIFQETYGDQQGYDEYRRKVRYRIIPFLF
jgi:tetratricopeptide (TPR) repeat protein